MNENTSHAPHSTQRKSNWWFLIVVLSIVIGLYALGISLQYSMEQEQYSQLKLKLDQQQAEENKLLGEKLDAYATPIIQAIEQYKHDKGSYPENLNDLVPTYLRDQPYAAFKDDLRYSPETNEYTGTPFYFGFTGDYKFTLNSETYVYCPVTMCKIPLDRGTYRINQNWVYIFGKW